MRDGELQDARQRHAYQPQQHVQIHANLPGEDTDALGPAQQAVELVGHSDTSSGEGGESGAGYAQARKRSQPENQTGVENQIDDV